MSSAMKKIPFEIKDVQPDNHQELVKYFKGNPDGFIDVNGYILPRRYKSLAQKIYNFKVRPDDTWIITYPKSGTTLTQELVWLLANNLDYKGASEKESGARVPFLEFSCVIDEELKRATLERMKMDKIRSPALEKILTTHFFEVLEQMPSPRYIKSHLPLSILPPDLLTSGAKIVFVLRNPKSVAVSFYHHSKMFSNHDFVGDFEKFWGFYMKGITLYGSYFQHAKEILNHKDNPNINLMFYEDMIKDMPNSIKRIAKFLNKVYSEEEVNGLATHVHIDNFRGNPAVNMSQLHDTGFLKGQFIRKGKAGEWRENFTPKLDAEADQWIEENAKKFELDLPYFKKP